MRILSLVLGKASLLFYCYLFHFFPVPYSHFFLIPQAVLLILFVSFTLQCSYKTCFIFLYFFLSLYKQDYSVSFCFLALSVSILLLKFIHVMLVSIPCLLTTAFSMVRPLHNSLMRLPKMDSQVAPDSPHHRNNCSKYLLKALLDAWEWNC